MTSVQHDEDIKSRIARLETMVGETPGEGLRHDMNELRKVVLGMQRQFYLAMGGAAVIYWLLNAALGK